MRYRQFEPVAALAPYVRCAWVMSDDAEAPNAELDHVVPDGCVELIVHLGASFQVEQSCGGFRQSPGSVIAGQITRCLRMRPTGPYTLVGIRFQPWGAPPFLEVPVHRLTDHVVPLSAFFGSHVSTIEDRLFSARSDLERVRILQGELIGRRLSRSRHDAMVAHCVGRLTETGGRIAIEDLTGPHTVGSRQLERRFRDAVGIPPKLLARIIRFRRVFEFTERSAPVNWIGVALACGYYDQAHLIRDFRELAGRTPTEFLSQDLGIGRCLARAEMFAQHS